MFPTFIGILDIQSWWEVPSIAHFCSLFRAAFNLLDFDIEDLEEALLTDGGAEGRLVQELIVRLLEGCLPNDTRNDISTFNYQMFLRRLFRKKCQEYNCENPFNTDVDFELLPLRQKVEILRALCDFRLDAEDVECALSNLDSDSLRVEPLGHDRKNSAYWYFYGTRLYREDYVESTEVGETIAQRQRGRPRDRKRKRRQCRSQKESLVEEEKEKEVDDYLNINIGDKTRSTVWQVICFTQQDWTRLVDKFRNSEHDTERKLYHTLAEDFLPEIPKLFELKEKQQRRRLLERNNSRVLHSPEPVKQLEEPIMVRAKIKSKVGKSTKKSGQSSKAGDSEDEAPPALVAPPPPQKKGRQTNNSLASAVGQIIIQTGDEADKVANKKGVGRHGVSSYVAPGYPYAFGIEEEERRVGMYKVLESIKDHDDAWPFTDPVEEEYAPRYYSVVRKPMDLKTMEEKLENGEYKTIHQFKRDFSLIVENCRQYNGSENEYTEMAINLKEAFNNAIERFLESEPSSDECPPKSPPVSASAYPLRANTPAAALTNSRKRYKKSNKKSKSNKTDKKTRKSRNRNDNDDEDDECDYDFYDDEDPGEEEQVLDAKSSRDKRAKKRSKSIKERVDTEDDNQDDEDEEEDGAILENTVIKSKRKKYEVSKLLPKNKRLSAKDEDKDVKEETKKSNTGTGNKKGQKDASIKNSKEHKENRGKKKEKDNFEEYHEPLENVKSKSKRIEKKSNEKTGSAVQRNDKIKKGKSKKQVEESEDERYSDIEENGKQIRLEKKKNSNGSGSNSNNNSNSNKDKIDQRIRRSDNDKYEVKSPTRVKDNNKKSKKKNDEQTKNGKVNNDCGKDRKKEASEVSSVKFDSSLSDKDLESLDSLKDRISERSRREEKLKLEREKLKKTSKSSTFDGFHKKNVPSNGNTFHDSDKVNNKRTKVKKSGKDKKVEEKNQQVEVRSSGKLTKSKGSRVESPAIQALNQATAQTLNDINKWLDDAPPVEEFNSKTESPILQPSTSEPTRAPPAAVSGPKVSDLSRKRPATMKLFGTHGPPKPKKVQRTIDRLQPGKSKGNLLLKKPIGGNNSGSDVANNQSNSDANQSNRESSDEPKLSLGSVLKNADSIQLICKSLVSSPTANLSNEDEDEDRPTLLSSTAALKEDKSKESMQEAVALKTQVEAINDIKESEESQKPKSATPNLSAWFKAFGAPKSKKKEEEIEEVPKKEEPPEVTLPHRQRRHSAGGSSVSESVSSFSQESPPGLSVRSPQTQSAITTPGIEQPVRAGFYQDALSTGSSPYNSPYYTTPPRYSAQLPPTPSPQNHPLSPAYPSSAAYEQNPLYPQASHQVYQKPGSNENPGENYNFYPQNSPQGDAYQQQLSSSPKPSPVYPQPSPQPVPVYQNSPQATPPNYSQHSPQQPPTPNYSQPSPQPPPGNYSQPSPQQPTPPSYSQTSPQPPTNYSQPSPSQQSSSSYSQPSPKPPPSYSQVSPQPPASYSQPSPQFNQPAAQPPNYSQTSPQPNYSQPSPQSHNFSQPSPQPPKSYTQHSPQPPPAYSQPSPQNLNYSQPSPQTPPNYSQPSPQTPPNYSQPSPQAPPNYSQPSPQAPPNYSQPSPQAPPNYSQPSPQAPPNYSQPSPNYSQLSPQQTSTTPGPTYSTQPSPQPPRNYSQPSSQVTPCLQPTLRQSQQNYPQQSPRQSAPAQIYAQPKKSTEEYQTSAPPSYPQGIKSNHLPYTSSGVTAPGLPEPDRRVSEYYKSEEKLQADPPLGLNSNHQVFHQPNQFTQLYSNNFPINERVSCPPTAVDSQRSSSRINAPQEPQQQPQSQERAYENSETLKYTQQRQDQQLLAFQQNLPGHETIYQPTAGFQAPPYSMPNPGCRPVYSSSHYYDAGSKTAGPATSVASTLPPVKKRMYNEPTGDSARNCLPQEARPGQEQYGYDQIISLPTSETSMVPGQYDSTYGLADSVAGNPAYARLSLGLVGRSPKDQQQLLSIPRPSSKDSLVYSRTSGSEYDLNLLQSMQGAKGMSAAPMQRRETAPVSAPAPKAKKGRKKAAATSATQQQSTPLSNQSSTIPGFPQYPGNPADIVGLKNSPVPPGSAFNFTTPVSDANSSAFYDKEASAAAAAFAFLGDLRNSSSYYSILRQQQQQQQQQQQPQPSTPINESSQQGNKLNNQPRNYPPHPFLHTTQRSAAYGPPVSPYVSPHAPNLSVDPAAYQQYLHSYYALQPSSHPRSWL